MPIKFTPSPDLRLVRKPRTTDEQLAAVMNQSIQAIVDNLQLAANTLTQLTQQVSGIDQSVGSIETSYNTQLTALQTAQSNASPILATSLTRNNSVNSLVTQNNSAVAKISAASAALTAANNNLISVQANAQPYRPFLQAIAALNRPNNTMTGTNGAGAVVALFSSGQSFTIEMAEFTLDRTSTANGGSIAIGSFVTNPINTKGFVNTRNQFGLEEVTLNNNTNTITVPCTGGNCLYYVFSVSSFCGIGGGNSRVVLDGTAIATGSAVQSIAGRSNAAEDFNQHSAAFGTFTVGSASPTLALEAIAQAVHPTTAAAAIGRSVGGGVERYSTVLLLRRRILS